jgi:hypothetical protein
MSRMPRWGCPATRVSRSIAQRPAGKTPAQSTPWLACPLRTPSPRAPMLPRPGPPVPRGEPERCMHFDKSTYLFAERLQLLSTTCRKFCLPLSPAEITTYAAAWSLPSTVACPVLSLGGVVPEGCVSRQNPTPRESPERWGGSGPVSLEFMRASPTGLEAWYRKCSQPELTSGGWAARRKKGRDGR